MEEEQQEQQSSEQDDWLAGATVEARAQDIALHDIAVSFDGLDLPGPEVA
jgi:hypothetical protein